jgi:uroporphyrinogen-III synthase
MEKLSSRRRPARLRPGIGPLAGATVVLTRPAGSVQPLRRRVRALGGTTLALPGVSLHAAPDAAAALLALRQARAADFVVFISPAAVRFAFALLPGLRFTRATQVCAIGASTANALQRQGVSQVLWPRERADSEGLLALPQLAHVRGKQVVLIGAPGGRELLADTLRARRARVAHAPVYARRAPRFNRRQFAALEQARAPLITVLSSAEVLDNLRAVLPLELFARLAAGELVVSSARLAAAARASLFGNVHVAASALPADLCAAAITAVARHRI